MATPENTHKTVLIVMAHPDDGEFMAGATIARWAREGHTIHYCVMTNGDCGSSDPAMTSAKLVPIRRQEQQEAARRLGVTTPIIFLDQVDTQLEVTLENRRAVARLIRQLRPDIVLSQDPTTFYQGQAYINHIDHRHVGEITLAAIMPDACTRLVFPELLAEGLEPHKITELYLANTRNTDRWVGLTKEDVERQVDALRAHASQLSTDPAERVEAGLKEGAAVARTHGHDFAYAQGFKYIRFG